MAGIKGQRIGGRQPGTPNKATAEIRDLARKYTPEALIELARLTTQAESEQARVSAIKELFDRAYGKSTQILANEDNQDFRIQIVTGVPRADG